MNKGILEHALDIIYAVSLTLLGSYNINENFFSLSNYQIVLVVFIASGIIKYKMDSEHERGFIEDILKDFIVALLALTLLIKMTGKVDMSTIQTTASIGVHGLYFGIIFFLTSWTVKICGDIAYYTHACIPIIMIVLLKLNCPILPSVIIAILLPEPVNYLGYKIKCKLKNNSGKILRKNRKKCIHQIGKQKYEFDKTEELLKYKYLCGAKMGRIEWIKCGKRSMPYSFYEWKESIQQKYNPCSIEQLEEFARYLELGIKDNNASKDSANIIFAALASSAMAVTFGKLVEIQSIKLISFIIDVVFAILALIVIIYCIYFPLYNDNLEKNLYKDYQDIIKQIIDEKKDHKDS